MNEDPEFYEDDYLLYNTEEKLGIEKVRRAIESRLSESENIRTWNEKLYRYISASAPAKSNPAPDKQNEITLQEIKTRIENAEGNIPAIYTVFGKNTSDENITELFNMLKTEKRPEQLVRLFWIFRKRKLPEIDEQLISLTENSNSQLAKAAVSALANLSDERLRIRGLELQNQREWTKAAMGISLLIRNYKSGDNDSVEKLLTRMPDNADIDELHFAVNECLKTAENNPGKEMLNILLYIYENSPCMQCREKAVKLMIENKILPAEYRNEGCYDACLEIRDIFNTD